MSDHRPAYWKMILTIAPILGASLIAASLTVDEYHNCESRAGKEARVIGFLINLMSFLQGMIVLEEL
jgi:diacylglycerol diphosphate phosphatase/phosphatidate phosphatase